MSGTIPSMETTHNELKDNTIVIGPLSFIIPGLNWTCSSPDFWEIQSLERLETLQRRRCVLSVSPFVSQNHRG